MQPLEELNPKPIIRQNGGQILLEYILLLTVAVGAATLITTRLVGRSADNPGVVIQKWSELVQMVGEDIGD